MNWSGLISSGTSFSNCQHGGGIGSLDLEVLHNLNINNNYVLMFQERKHFSWKKILIHIMRYICL